MLQRVQSKIFRRMDFDQRKDYFERKIRAKEEAQHERARRIRENMLSGNYTTNLWDYLHNKKKE